jgi:hypothetical protein
VGKRDRTQEGQWGFVTNEQVGGQWKKTYKEELEGKILSRQN